MSDYSTFRTGLAREIVCGASPNTVAEILEHAKDRFPQITWDEINRLRSWGNSWMPHSTRVHESIPGF